MGLDLNDSGLGCFFNELLLEGDIASRDSEDDIESAPVVFIDDLRLVIVLTFVDEVPKEVAPLLGLLGVVRKPSHLVHVRAIETGDVHWEDGWSVVVSVRRILTSLPIAEDWDVFLCVAEQIFSDTDDGTASCA